MTVVEASGAEVRSRLGTVLRRPATWLVLALVAVVAVLTGIAEQVDEERVLDPRSTEPNGTRGLVLFLEQLGSSVFVDESIKGDTVLILQDDLANSQRQELADWVRRGGTLVVADPASPLSGGSPRSGFAPVQPTVLRPQCDSPLVEDVAGIRPQEQGIYSALEPSDDIVGCFPANQGDYLQVRDSGSGRVVTLADPFIFSNAQLALADNSVLVANLLGDRGNGDVTIIQRTQLPSSGDQTLSDLVPDWLNKVFLQLAVAALLLMLWAGRRLGRPVEDAELVDLPASGLTAAVGNLLQTSRHKNAAARVLRANARRNVATLLGMPETTDARTLARVATRRTGVSEQRLLGAMIDQPITTEDDLLRLAQHTEDVHREVRNAR